MFFRFAQRQVTNDLSYPIQFGLATAIDLCRIKICRMLKAIFEDFVLIIMWCRRMYLTVIETAFEMHKFCLIRSGKYT